MQRTIFGASGAGGSAGAAGARRFHAAAEQ
jgi:hypothetical protein